MGIRNTLGRIMLQKPAKLRQYAPPGSRLYFQRTLTAFTPKYAYYLEYFSFFKCEKSVTTLVIGGGELEKGR